MIDKYKIEKAARRISDNVADDRGFDESKPADIGYLEGHCAGFIVGANWAILEFLKDLWHPYDEVPTRKDSNILQFFESYSTGTEDDFDEYFELANTREGFTQETWEEFMNEGGVPSKWLYIDDLLPKEGCKK